jgi:hypothetical protein
MKKNLITTTLTALTLAAAFTVQAADLHVPANYPTIQAAVTAASNGDTIHIAPGVYPGQTIIERKNLTLIGQPGTILRATPDMPVWFFRPVLGIKDSEVNLSHLSFEGEQLADVLNGLFGAYYVDSGGRIENCRFTGFRESIPGSNFSVALRFFNDLDNAPMVNVHVVGNTIVDTHDGIALIGATTNPSITFSILDNTIIGSGPTTGEQPIGIRIGRGAGGEVKRNTISDFSYVDPQSVYPAWGMLALPDIADGVYSFLPPIVIEGNTFRDNQGHLGIVAFAGAGTTVTNNTFVGTAPGARPCGLAMTGENVTITGNRFSQMEEGIRLVGDDPVWGTLFGITDDAQLIDNRFCDVANPINLQPLATATEQGTLFCPFPEPVLDIASAVLLCWPEFEDGYVVETAPTPDGPWTPSDATPFLEAGQTCIAVATTGEQQYFRLRQPGENAQ